MAKTVLYICAEWLTELQLEGHGSFETFYLFFTIHFVWRIKYSLGLPAVGVCPFQILLWFDWQLC